MRLLIGYAARPLQDIPPCGDGWLSLAIGSTRRLLFADGIGHGHAANRIVIALCDQMTWLCRRSSRPPSLEGCLRELHRELRGHAAADTAQAAVALVDVDGLDNSLTVLIVGNIEVHYHAAGMHMRFPSQHGMVGGTFPRQLRVSRTPLRPASLLSLFSDGLESRAAGEHLLQLHARAVSHGLHPQQEAEALLQRCGRSSDDASCALLWMPAGRC